MNVQEIWAALLSIEKEGARGDETNYTSRARALDELEFKVFEPLGRLPAERRLEGRTLLHAAEALKRTLEVEDGRMFQQLRANIRAGGYRGADFKQMIWEYVGDKARNIPAEAGYSELDLFIHELLFPTPPPQEILVREPEMVGYQPTPAHIVFELSEKAQFTPDDLFYDLGAGLGQVAFLVHLLSGVAVRGVEVEPAFCQFARACAADLHLTGVSFLQADARQVDYSEGTVFFMYTPFTGKMLQDVLDQLHQISPGQNIQLFTYGPCTPTVAKQTWLECLENGTETDKLGVFRRL